MAESRLLQTRVDTLIWSHRRGFKRHVYEITLFTRVVVCTRHRFYCLFVKIYKDSLLKIRFNK